MRFLSICCTVFIIMCVIMQHQSIEAKPFIFKFFLPQAPAPARDTSSSTSTSTSLQFPDILSTKLRLLTSILQSATSSSGGYSFGFKKVFTGTSVTTTTKPNTSTTNTTPDAVFEPEDSTHSTTNSGSKTSTTTEETGLDKTTEKSGSDILSESINKNGYDYSTSTEKNSYDYSTSKVTTDKSGYDYSTSKVTTDKNGYDYSTSKVTTDKSGYDYSTHKNGYDYSTSKVTNDNSSPKVATGGYDYSSKVTTFKPDSKPGYNYQLPSSAMIENEISNEVIMINNQYLPAL